MITRIRTETRQPLSATMALIRERQWVEEGIRWCRLPDSVTRTEFLKGTTDSGRSVDIEWCYRGDRITALFPGGSIEFAAKVVAALREDGIETANVTVLEDSDPTVLWAADVHPDRPNAEHAGRYILHCEWRKELCIQDEVPLEPLQAALDALVTARWAEFNERVAALSGAPA